jgi:predicted GIY-YIG superfamily endonuclease
MKGVLYRFQCRQTGKFYIGSTTQTIKKRLKNHKSKAKEYHRRNTPLYSHVNSVGWNSMDIIIVTERDFDSKPQLLQLEKDEIMKYLTDVKCLNHNKPIRTLEEKKEHDKQYGKQRRLEQKERERQRVSEWRKNNPEKYAEQKKRSIEKINEKRHLAKEAKNNVENNTN